MVAFSFYVTDDHWKETSPSRSHNNLRLHYTSSRDDGWSWSTINWAILEVPTRLRGSILATLYPSPIHACQDWGHSQCLFWVLFSAMSSPGCSRPNLPNRPSGASPCSPEYQPSDAARKHVDKSKSKCSIATAVAITMSPVAAVSRQLGIVCIFWRTF